MGVKTPIHISDIHPHYQTGEYGLYCTKKGKHVLLATGNINELKNRMRYELDYKCRAPRELVILDTRHVVSKRMNELME